MIRKTVIVSLIILCFQGGRAQSLLHSKPLDYNPGFAGSKTYDRLSFNFNELSLDSRNLYFSYDRLVQPLRGGIGFYGQSEHLHTNTSTNEENNLEQTTIGAVYSPKFIVKRSLQLSPFIDIAGMRHTTESLDQIDEVTSLLLYRENKLFFRSKVGFLVNNQRFYAGYTLINSAVDDWYLAQDLQAGYIHPISRRQNIILDGRMRLGEIYPPFMRTYNNQVNVALQHGVAFIGGGLNDLTTGSVIGGLKLVNLKFSMAYHILSPSDFTNTEIAVQYVFDRNNDEKLITPFEKWWIKLKM